MFGDYKVVACTPGGRRQYLELLVPTILASPLVDEYQLWLNTDCPADLAYMRQLAAGIPRVVAVEPAEGVATGPHRGLSINQFIRNCTEKETIYIRFDDDIVFAEDTLIERLLEYRVKFPRYFLLLPLVINNPICSFLLANEGRLDPILKEHPHFRADSAHVLQIYWNDRRFPEVLHRYFLDLLHQEQLDRLRMRPCPSLINRLSINCIVWFGTDLAEAGGVPLGVDEEEWLGAVVPMRARRANGIMADVIASHYAFYTQREYLDTTDLLPLYREQALTRYAPIYAGYPGLQYDRSIGMQSIDSAFAALPGEATLYTQSVARSGRKLRFNADGSVSGGHENESFWRREGNCLCTVHREGTVTARLEFVPGRLDNQCLLFRGAFLGAPNETGRFKGVEHIITAQR